MKYFTKFCSDVKNEEEVLFSPIFDNDFICIEDTVHIGTKLRNRLLKPSILLPIGNKIASISHLKILINCVEKDVHGLVISDICVEDRQNYKSLEKIMDSKVVNALSEHILQSEATIMYLKLCSEITSSFIDINLSPLERIYRIFHATYFIRIWRAWLIKNSKEKEYSILENFISANAYTCIELNAHNLVRLIRRLRSMELEELFLPFLFSSQPCEEMFRQLRSMGTVNFTKINFSMLEVMHLISRIELQNDIVYSKLTGLGVSFPRNKIKSDRVAKFQLPSNNGIKETMENALENAMKDAIAFGMEINCKNEIKCAIEETILKDKQKQKRKIEEIYLEENVSAFKKTKFEHSNTKSYSLDEEDVEYSNSLVEVEN